MCIWLQEQKIEYYDHMVWTDARSKAKYKAYGQFYLKRALEWLNYEAMSKKNMSLKDIYQGNDNWTLIDDCGENLPPQTDGSGCGVFCIVDAGFLADNVPILHSLFDVNRINYRKILGCDILRGELKI
jgi:hypothetical protein